jgi:hypothetical protein
VAVVGELLAVTALLLFSANVVLVGAATRRVPQDLGFLLGLVGNVVVAGLVAAGQLALGGRLPPPEWDAVALFAVGGVLTAFVGRWFFFRSVTTLGPTRASTVQVSNPVFAALAAWTLLGEALPPGAVLFAGTVLAGLYLTSRQTGAAGAGTDTGPVPLGEVGLALLGAVAYGLGNVARGASVRDWPVPVVGGLVEAAAALAVYATLNTDLRTIGAAVRGADPAVAGLRGAHHHRPDLPDRGEPLHPHRGGGGDHGRAPHRGPAGQRAVPPSHRGSRGVGRRRCRARVGRGGGPGPRLIAVGVRFR